MRNNDTACHHSVTPAEELFAKVTSVEGAVTNPSTDEDALFTSLSLFETCMGIVAEATVIDLTTEQRDEFNTRMNRVQSQLQQLALSAFAD